MGETGLEPHYKGRRFEGNAVGKYHQREVRPQPPAAQVGGPQRGSKQRRAARALPVVEGDAAKSKGFRRLLGGERGGEERKQRSKPAECAHGGLGEGSDQASASRPFRVTFPHFP